MIKPFPFVRAQMQNCIDRTSKKNPLGLAKDELVAHAAARGLSTGGNKAELCERIISFEEGKIGHLPLKVALPPPLPLKVALPLPIALPARAPVGRKVVIAKKEEPRPALLGFGSSPLPIPIPVPKHRVKPIISPPKALSSYEKEDMDMQLAEGISLRKPFYRDLAIIKPFSAPQMEQGDEIGRGSFGSVAVLKTQPDVVVKRYNTYTKDVLKEITYLKNLNGLPSIVKVYGFTPGKIYGSGKSAVYRLYLQKYDKVLPYRVTYTEAQFKSTIFKVIEGVYNIHMRGIIHADLKPHNTLVKGDEVAVADLGIARLDLPMWTSDWSVTSALQTAWYRAPEVVLARTDVPHSQAIDIWSLGCMMYDLIMSEQIFPYPNNNELYLNMVRLFGHFPYTTPDLSAGFGFLSGPQGPKVPPLTADVDRWIYIFAGHPTGPPAGSRIPDWALKPELLRLLTAMFQYDPVDRINIVDLINSDYFSDIRGSKVYPNLNWVQRFRYIQKDPPVIAPKLLETAQFASAIDHIISDVSSHRARALALDLLYRCAEKPENSARLLEFGRGCSAIAATFHDTRESTSDLLAQEEVFNVVDNNLLTSTYYDFLCAVGAQVRLSQPKLQKAINLIYNALQTHTSDPILYSTDYLTQAVTAIAAATGIVYGPKKYYNKALYDLILS